MGVGTALLLSLLISLNTASAKSQIERDFGPTLEEERTFPEYWRDVGLKLEYLRPVLTHKICKSSESAFVGCFAGINAALATIEKEKYVFIPQTRLADVKRKYEVVADFKVAKILKILPEEKPSEVSDETRADYVQRLKAVRLKSHAAIVQLYKKGKKRKLKFNKVYDWIEKNILIDPKINESYLVANLYNGYLGSAYDPHTYTIPAAYWDFRDKASDSAFLLGTPPAEKNVEYSVINHREKLIGFIKLNSFIEKSCDEMESAVRALTKQKVKGLILDLRNNGGGRLEQAVCITSIFIGPNKTVVVQKYLDASIKDRKEKTSEDAIQMTKLPLVTLVNARSASASEVVSGALQDYQRSLILGERTYGKATVQSRISLEYFGDYKLPKDNGMYFMKTIARFYLPSGRTNQIVGIIPDIEAFDSPDPTEDDKVVFREEDSYLNSLPPAGPQYVPNRPKVIRAISECMAKSGKARKLYAVLSAHSPTIPDFQQLTAEDALSCM